MKPERTVVDGAVGVETDASGVYFISVEHDGKQQTIKVSARRLLGMMSLMLKLPLSKTSEKEIRM